MPVRQVQPEDPVGYPRSCGKKECTGDRRLLVKGPRRRRSLPSTRRPRMVRSLGVAGRLRERAADLGIASNRCRYETSFPRGQVGRTRTMVYRSTAAERPQPSCLTFPKARVADNQTSALITNCTTEKRRKSDASSSPSENVSRLARHYICRRQQVR